MYAQAGLSICWSHIQHCWKSHVTAHYESTFCFNPYPANIFVLKILSAFCVCGIYSHALQLGRVAQLVSCLATDACLTADPGVASSTPARYHTFVEIDHEIISTVILLPSADLFKKGCCQLQAKVCAQITG